MQIIIPMSGSGSRFLQAGYRMPKPLIPVDGKPMIEHVVNMYPGETKILFICSAAHLRETNMKSVLARVAPQAQVLPIEPHKKGPVFAVAQAAHLIDECEETIISYCDFSKYYDYRDFLSHARMGGSDGAVTAYRGFHPHMLYPTNYAFIRERGGLLEEIREKLPFTDDRMSEYASDGSYYFRSGHLVKRYFTELMARDINVHGEYYVSMVYNLMVRDGLRVSVHEIQHMLQWGAPRDLEEYQKWSEYFRAAIEPPGDIRPLRGSVNVIPMAGRGQRFVAAGWATPKPMIEVSGKPMIVQAAASLPAAEKNVFVCLRDHGERFPVAAAIGGFRDAEIVPLEAVTDGQASTCELGMAGEALDAPLLIGTSDWGVRWNAARYQALVDDPGVDAIVWTCTRHHMAAINPRMYGWVVADAEGAVTRISVKRPVSPDPYNDHVIVSVFFFREVRLFLEGLAGVRSCDMRVNGEFYVDSVMQWLVEHGARVKLFPVEHYASWGTPNELRTFEYWQSFFHKSPDHPYRLENDRSFAPASLERYATRYSHQG